MAGEVTQGAVPNQDLPATVPQDYRSLFHTIAGYMAPQPGRLYSVSPRRRRTSALAASSATAAGAINTVTPTVALVDTISPADALWIESIVLALTNTLTLGTTINGVDPALTNSSAAIIARIGTCFSTLISTNSLAVTTLTITPSTPFWSFSDIAQFSNSLGQPWNIQVAASFLNGATANQVVNATLTVMYRKVMSQQEG